MFFSFDRDTSKIIAITTGQYYPMYLNTGATVELANWTCLGRIEFTDYGMTIRKNVTLVNSYDSGKFRIEEEPDTNTPPNYAYYLYASNSNYEDNDYLTCAIKADILDGSQTTTEQGIT